MFSFHSSITESLSSKEVVDTLEYKKPNAIPAHMLARDFFKIDSREKHRNTYLLSALAWNRLHAASILLTLDVNKEALDVPDSWPTCRNTPLILAAKINATKIGQRIIALGANVDAQDYRGFTALHYACLYRNHDMITSLLAAKANICLRDAFGKLPLDYYAMDISAADLNYRYGMENIMFICEVNDNNDRYFATRKKCLSALRWYVPHIIANADLHVAVTIDADLRQIAERLLKVRSPVYDAYTYTRMMKCFLALRSAVMPQLTPQLSPVVADDNAYTQNKYDTYRINPLFMVPPSAISSDKKDEVWVEMQALLPGL